MRGFLRVWGPFGAGSCPEIWGPTRVRRVPAAPLVARCCPQAHRTLSGRVKVKQMRQRLTYANVMATAAVFLALGGGAYAATHLAKNSVGPSS